MKKLALKWQPAFAPQLRAKFFVGLNLLVLRKLETYPEVHFKTVILVSFELLGHPFALDLFRLGVCYVKIVT